MRKPILLPLKQTAHSVPGICVFALSLKQIWMAQSALCHWIF